MKQLYLEGARGVGKSYVSRTLRDITVETILIEHTGLRGEKKEETQGYYREMLKTCNNVERAVSVIHDRSPISDIVYAHTYKDYRYSEEEILEYLDLMAGSHVYLFETDLISKGLEREAKAELFGEISDNEEESLKLMKAYRKFFSKYSGEMEKRGIDVQIRTMDYGKESEKVIKELASALNKED